MSTTPEHPYVTAYNQIVRFVREKEKEIWVDLAQFQREFRAALGSHLEAMRAAAKNPQNDDDSRAGILVARIDEHFAQQRYGFDGKVGVLKDGKKRSLQPISQKDFDALPLDGAALAGGAATVPVSPATTANPKLSDAVASQPIPSQLTNLVNNRQLTTQQLGDLIAVNNYVANGLNALPMGESTSPLVGHSYDIDAILDKLGEPARTVIFRHLTGSADFYVVTKLVKEFDFVPLATMQYPVGYAAPALLNEAAFSEVVARLNTSIDHPAAVDANAAVPISDALQKLVTNHHFTQQQMDDWVRAHNHIVAAIQNMPPENADIGARIEAYQQAENKWRELNKCCNRWEDVNVSTDFALFDNLLKRIRLGDDNIKNPPCFFALRDGSVPIPTCDEFTALLTRLNPPEAAQYLHHTGRPQNLDAGFRQLFEEVSQPLSRVQAPGVVVVAEQTLSDAGRRALASDFHARVVAELEASVGTLSGRNKKDITVTLHSAGGSSHTLDLVLSDAAKREKPALADAFREVVVKLQKHARVSTAQDGTFLVSRQQPWAPEQVGDLRALAAAAPVSKFARPAETGERVPVQFMAKTVAGLLDGLNAGLGEGKKLDAEKYAKPDMLADVAASTAGESAGGVSRRYSGGRR